MGHHPLTGQNYLQISSSINKLGSCPCLGGSSSELLMCVFNWIGLIVMIRKV